MLLRKGTYQSSEQQENLLALVLVEPVCCENEYRIGTNTRINVRTGGVYMGCVGGGGGGAKMGGGGGA